MGYCEFSRRINECVGGLFLSPCLDFRYFRINKAASCLKRDITCDKQLRNINWNWKVRYSENYVRTSLDSMVYKVRKQKNKTVIPLTSRSGKE